MFAYAVEGTPFPSGYVPQIRIETAGSGGHSVGALESPYVELRGFLLGAFWLLRRCADDDRHDPPPHNQEVSTMKVSKLLGATMVAGAANASGPPGGPGKSRQEPAPGPPALGRTWREAAPQAGPEPSLRPASGATWR